MGKANRGHGSKAAIAMCVHYATLFSSLASAMGFAVRSVITTEDLSTANGHFMAEVWDSQLGKWVLHDPTFDVHYEDHRPLSSLDIADRNHRGESLRGCLVVGQNKAHISPGLRNWFNEYALSGRCFHLTGIWARNQYVSDPTVAPPAHGAIGYCETDIIWYNPADMDIAPMFPYRAAKREYFDRSPFA